MLSAHHINKSFGANVVLQGVDITIAPGSITCVIGPSGTGKTTLLRALALLEPPDTGTVTIDDRVYEFGAQSPTLDPHLRLPLKRGRKTEEGGGKNSARPPVPQGERGKSPWPHVTAVFQSLFLWPHLNLRENIMLPARNVNPDAARDLEGLIKFFEMEGFIDAFPNEASVGQRQRVALARALILNPRYVLLDEITSALDIEQTAKILTKLTHLKERGIGVFLITHHIGFAARAADQVVFMDGGRIAEIGGAAIIEAPKTVRLAEFLDVARMVG